MQNYGIYRNCFIKSVKLSGFLEIIKLLSQYVFIRERSFYEAIVNGYLIFGRKRVWDSLSYSAILGFPCVRWPAA